VTNLSVSNTLYAVETPRTLMMTKLLSPESDPKIQRTRTLPLGKTEKLTHTEKLAIGKSITHMRLTPTQH